MSFKRDGDDRSQLNVLKKRRVADLLSNFIPEDEAILMKNGRYCCLVCSHRPIFDTVDMLTVHRKGKRHLEGMRLFYGKKSQLKKDVEKRNHQIYINEEEGQDAVSSAPLLTETRKITHHALLKSTPYSSIHKRTSTKGNQDSFGLGQDTIRALLHDVDGSNPTTAPFSPSDTSTADCLLQEGQRKTKRRAALQSSPQPEKPLTEQRRKELEHYLKLKSAGWIQDRSGNWVKDDNVEFDSDEEEPPSTFDTP